MASRRPGSGQLHPRPHRRPTHSGNPPHPAGRRKPGLLGEYSVFPQTGVVRIPDYLSFEEASCLPCAALTAWNALYGLVPIRPGQTVLLQGTGGVSTFGLQIAAAAGATTIVTSSSDEKLEKAKQVGATHTINYCTTPDWASEAKRINNGHGVDHIIEVGAPSLYKRPLMPLRCMDSFTVSATSPTLTSGHRERLPWSRCSVFGAASAVHTARCGRRVPRTAPGYAGVFSGQVHPTGDRSGF